MLWRLISEMNKPKTYLTIQGSPFLKANPIGQNVELIHIQKVPGWNVTGLL